MRYSRILAAGASALALAGVVAASAATASAAPAAPAATASAHYQYQRQWELRGPNQVSLTYLGSTYTYKVQFSTYKVPISWQKQGELLTGTLTDKGLAKGQQTLQVNGTIFGNYVVFSVVYPASGPQGVRTFSGTIDKHGNVAGSWTETGTEAGSGPFTLLHPAHK
jgi:hypothetical protein